MAVLKTEDENSLVVLCKCGCDDGIRITVEKTDDEDYWYQTYLSGNWYKEQGTLLAKLKKIWAVIRNKDFYYSEIAMGKDDWETYKEWVNRH
mgnify:FL=1